MFGKRIHSEEEGSSLILIIFAGLIRCHNGILAHAGLDVSRVRKEVSALDIRTWLGHVLD